MKSLTRKSEQNWGKLYEWLINFNMEFFKSHFDKLLLTFLVLFFAVLALVSYHRGDNTYLLFCTDNAKVIVGALLTLITGSRLLQRNNDPKEDKNVQNPSGGKVNG